MDLVKYEIKPKNLKLGIWSVAFQMVATYYSANINFTYFDQSMHVAAKAIKR